MNLSKQDKSFYFLFVLFAIIELLQRLYLPIPSLTIFLACGLYYWIYLSIRHSRNINLSQEFNATLIIYLFLLWNLIIIIRGLIDCYNYWDYKNVLINKGPFLLFAFSIFISSRLNLLQKIISFILKYYLILSLIFIKPIFWANTGRIISNLIPLSVLFRKRLRNYLLFFVLLSIPFTWEARGWIIRAFFGLFLSVLILLKIKSHIKDYIIHTIMKITYIICIVIPIVFVYLGYTNKFNVFAMNEYITVENKENIVDTRSFLYRLVNQKLIDSQKTWIGLGGISNYWDDFNTDSKITSLKNKGRTATESGVLNMYLYGGWIGAFLFSSLFWVSAFYGIFRSENIICKTIGCFIIFRWVISFVDEPEIWLCSNLMLYLFMGICLNKRLRMVQNSQWYNWFKSIGKHD